MKGIRNSWRLRVVRDNVYCIITTDSYYSTGCDVAFMWGKHCYGVQCFTRDLCEAVPTRQSTKESIMLSHVTFQAEKSKLSVVFF